ncbi:MAG: septum formation initiator family protein [Acidobacteriota bacterium]|nr:septum formation initiator family protein [Acidobacteriota bacterium]
MSRQRLPRRHAEAVKAAPRPGRNRRYVNLALLFVISVIAMEGLIGNRGFLAMLQARRQYDQLEETIAREKAENARLAEEARLLREDPATIEDVARRELGLMMPGEKVFIVKDVPAPDSSRP